MSHPERLLVETRNKAQVRALVERAGLTWLNQGLAREQWEGEHEPAYHLAGVDGAPVRLLTVDEIEDYVRYARARRGGEFAGSWVEWFVSGQALAAWRLARKTRALQRLATAATRESKGGTSQPTSVHPSSGIAWQRRDAGRALLSLRRPGESVWLPLVFSPHKRREPAVSPCWLLNRRRSAPTSDKKEDTTP